MGTVDKYRIIYAVDNLCDLGRRTRRYLLDFLDCMEFITRIDTFGRLAGKKVLVELQSADAFHDGQTLLLRYTRVNGRFVNYDISF